MNIDGIMQRVITVYENEGIVTRNECPELDSRPNAREIGRKMQELGYENAFLLEVENNNYRDYSTALYDSERYTQEEVIDYMKMHVLE